MLTFGFAVTAGYAVSALQQALTSVFCLPHDAQPRAREHSWTERSFVDSFRYASYLDVGFHAYGV